MQTDRENRLVVITGGTRGIGRATAELFAGKGDRVVLGARTSGQINDVVAGAVGLTGSLSGLQLDVTDPMSADAFFRTIGDEIGVPDVCVFNAGIGHWGPVDETTDEQWTQTMGVNVDGAFNCTRAALRSMKTKRGGHLVYMSSVLGRRGVPNMAAYAASKAAVAAFGESVAREVKPFGMKVTVMYPGTTSTGMRQHQGTRPQTPDISDVDLQLRPIDVAEAIYWATTTSRYSFPSGLVIEPPGSPAG